MVASSLQRHVDQEATSTVLLTRCTKTAQLPPRKMEGSGIAKTAVRDTGVIDALRMRRHRLATLMTSWISICLRMISSPMRSYWNVMVVVNVRYVIIIIINTRARRHSSSSSAYRARVAPVVWRSCFIASTATSRSAAETGRRRHPQRRRRRRHGRPGAAPAATISRS